MVNSIQNQFRSDPPAPALINEVLWSMLGQGLIHIDMSQPAHENWEWRLSSAGRAASTDAEVNPDDPQGYLAYVKRVVPSASPVTMMYLEESVLSYIARRYLASAVMLGVAAESSFLEMADAFGHWLPSVESAKFRQVLGSRQGYVAKFIEFRKRLEPKKPILPSELADNMTLTLDSVVDVLRIYRNDAGHPTGRQIDREDAFINLQMAARAIQKLYTLKSFFKP